MVDQNGFINVIDYGIIGKDLFKDGYKIGDFYMNGVINFIDYGMVNKNLLMISKVYFICLDLTCYK